jgi:hypothetical protein
MRVEHNGIVLQINGLPLKKIPAGNYETTDPIEIELLTSLWNAQAITKIID